LHDGTPLFLISLSCVECYHFGNSNSVVLYGDYQVLNFSVWHGGGDAEINRFSIKINVMVEVCPLDGTVQFPPLEFYLSEILASGSQIKVGAGTIFPIILNK